MAPRARSRIAATHPDEPEHRVNVGHRGPSRLTRCCWVALVLGCGVFVDQWTKALAREHLVGGGRNYLAGGVRLVHAENSGAFLSLGGAMSAPVRYGVFVVANALLLALVMGFALVGPLAGRRELACYALILAGGIGNMVDRVARGTVTDFMQLNVGPVGTGIFNVADVAIMVGVIAIIAIGRPAPASEGTGSARDARGDGNPIREAGA